MNFYSQAGQDQFVHALLPKREGTFWDIGCGGLEISNTRGLEELGWRGLLVDNSPEARKASCVRPSPFFLANATEFSFPEPDRVDYLSLDVDGASLDALRNLPLDKTRFSVITVEHDFWRFGDNLRTPMLQLLTEHGYFIVCADVCNPDPFEIWAVDDRVFSLQDVERFVRSEPTQWRDILGIA